MSRIVIASFMAALLVLPVSSAPGLKDSDKPLPPPTPAQFQKSTNNLKMIGIAFHSFHDSNNKFPAYFLTKDGKPGLSWRVAILPYLEEDALYKQFKLDEPWDSENNMKLIEKMPKQYAPVRGNAEANKTFYQSFVGKTTMMLPDGGLRRFAHVTDGLSNTFMVVEGEKPVVWTMPDDLPFDGKTVPKLGGMFDGQFNALFGDGSVRRLPKGLDDEVLKLLIDCQDGMVIDIEGAIKKAQRKE